MIYTFSMILIAVGLQLLGILSFSWELLEIGESPILLGINLSISALIPYLMSKIAAVKRFIASKFKLYVRLVSASSSLVLLVVSVSIDDQLSVQVIMLYTLLFGVTTSMMLQGAEQANIYLKLSGNYTVNEVTKSVNYATQLGSIFFALAFGYVSNYWGLSGIFHLSSFSMLLYFAMTFGIHDSPQNKDTVNNSCLKNTNNNTGSTKNNLLKLFNLAVINSGMTLVLISVINESVIFDSITLGISDALAGVGAIVGIYFSNKVTGITLRIPVIILSCSYFFVGFTEVSLVLFVAIFLWGWSLNFIRYRVRHLIIKSVKNTGEAVDISILTVNVTVLANAITPIILGFILVNLSVLISIILLSILSFAFLIPSTKESEYEYN